MPMKLGLQTVCAADLEIDGVVALAKAEALQGLELATGYLGKFRGQPDGPEWHVNTADLLASAERYKVPRHLRCDDRRSLDDARIAEIIEWLWPDAASEQSRNLIRHVQEARPRLAQL